MNSRQLIRFVLGITAVFLFILTSSRYDPTAVATGSPTVLLSEELRQEVQKYGEIPIIIQLDVPAHRALTEGQTPDLAQMEQISQAITQTGSQLLDRLTPHNISQVKTYEYFPLLAMIVDEAALEALAADKSVIHIGLDTPVPPAMDDTLPLIRANNNHFLNYTGSGWSVAILDTGVDRFHPALAGKVISEACYSSNVAAAGASSLCPGGATSSTANNSALNCAAGISGCDHGTHVAGIAARVAPDAGIIAIQVFSRFTDSGSNKPCQDANRTSPCTLSYTSDQVAALNRVWALHVTTNNNINVASANMSLGGGSHTGPCDHLSQYNSLRLAIVQLRDQNVSTVIAAGNSGYRNAMAAPACLTPAISVASSDKSDVISSFSNISVFTTLIAPGSAIVAAVPQNMTPIYQSKGGTSMAAPHVAGAIATFKEARPGATVPQIISALTSTAVPTVTDNRSGGSVTKRRLDAWTSACVLISCDSDDFRTILANQTLNGSIVPAGDVDHYYYFGTAGQRLTLRMNRTSGSHDPYLELISPSGIRVAFNDNGGSGVNALINGYLLPQNGFYQIRARSVNNFTGSYQLISSLETVPLNPTPQINYLSPGSATGTFFGSDFWVAIYGSNFMPESQVRWNGQLRAKFYSSSTLIYIRVLGGDIGWPWPRNAFITVQNPTPGGGTSNSRAFSINIPFLGDSLLLSPDSGSSVPMGDPQSFAVEWIAPAETGTWRDMQFMDMRLRNEAGEIAAWVRVVERANADGGSFYRLLNASEEIVGEGLPGENVTLVLTDTVSLHLADSTFSGSGLTAVMTPSLTFGPAAVGTYNVEFRVDTKGGEEGEQNVQDSDVLGVFSVLPAGCDVALSDVTLSGSATGQTALNYEYTAAVSPLTATAPITYTWIPEPASGQGTTEAIYNFAYAGEHIVSVLAENCGSFAGDAMSVLVRTTSNPDLGIMKEGPATAVAGQPISYTLTISNSGMVTATNLLISDPLPAGVTHVSGGTLVGNTVHWSLDNLAGYGTAVELTMVVTAVNDINDSDYSVSANGGYSANGTTAAQTTLYDAQAHLTPLEGGLLQYMDQAHLNVPGGAVFAGTVLAYRRLSSPSHPLPGGATFAGHALQLSAYQDNYLQSDFQLAEAVTFELAYSSEKSAHCTVTNPATGEYALFNVPGGLAPVLHYWTGSQWSAEGINCLFAIYLPAVLSASTPDPYAQITAVSLDGSQYAVQFQAYHFQPHVNHTHVHFFFNTVPPSEAGLPGAGPWYVYGGGSPFTGYGPADRPEGATQMCVLVANHDHTVIQGTGNCYDLP